jgi:hypothetical protein
MTSKNNGVKMSILDWVSTVMFTLLLIGSKVVCRYRYYNAAYTSVFLIFIICIILRLTMHGH